MKKIIEKRNSLIEEMEGLVNKTKTETRGFDETESARFEELKKEIKGLDEVLKADKEQREFQKVEDNQEEKLEDGKEDREMEDIEKRELEIREAETAFVEMISGKRALDVANNGAVIPEIIANRIIEKVKELSPIVAMSTIFNEGAQLKFPVYDETNSTISAGYVDDMAELIEGTGKFTVVTLGNNIVGSLAKISKSLMNRAGIDVASYAINKVAQALAEFLEKELIVGATKMKGLTTSTNIVTTATVAKIVADDLIDVQLTVPEVFQAKACWIMNKTDFAKIRKLKDLDGNYILTKDFVAGFGYILLGKTVYISQNADAIYYGDMSGVYVKFAQGVEIQVLLEKYATQHAIGVVGYLEADSNIIEPQKIVKLEIAA